MHIYLFIIYFVYDTYILMKFLLSNKLWYKSLSLFVCLLQELTVLSLPMWQPCGLFSSCNPRTCLWASLPDVADMRGTSVSMAAGLRASISVPCISTTELTGSFGKGLFQKQHRVFWSRSSLTFHFWSRKSSSKDGFGFSSVWVNHMDSI